MSEGYKHYLSKDEFREMVREMPEYREGRLSKEQAEELVDYYYTNQENILKEHLTAEIRRELMWSVIRGALEYDPEADTYHRPERS